MDIPTDIVLDRIDAVCAALGLRRAQRAYEQIADGLLTRPVHVGRSSCWPRYEVQSLVAARVSGATTDEIRTLVDELHELRKRLRPTPGAAA